MTCAYCKHDKIHSLTIRRTDRPCYDYKVREYHEFFECEKCQRISKQTVAISGSIPVPLATAASVKNSPSP